MYFLARPDFYLVDDVNAVFLKQQSERICVSYFSVVDRCVTLQQSFAMGQMKIAGRIHGTIASFTTKSLFAVLLDLK